MPTSRRNTLEKLLVSLERWLPKNAALLYCMVTFGEEIEKITPETLLVSGAVDKISPFYLVVALFT
jgi:hypothetical protein